MNSAVAFTTAARKGSQRLGADLRVSVTRSTVRERVTIAIFLAVPFVVAALFVQHVAIPRQAGMSTETAAVSSELGETLRRHTKQGLLASQSTADAAREGLRNTDDDSETQSIHDEGESERVFLEGIGTSDTIDRIRMTRLERRARRRARIESGDRNFDTAGDSNAGGRERADEAFADVSAPHVSLVASCRDRSSALLQALGTWLIALDDDDELILVDWSTDERLLSVAAVAELAGNDDRVVTVSASDQHDWILSRAYNLAARLASGRNLLKVDCDTLLEPGFLAAHPLDDREGEPGVFYKTAWQAARDENEVHLNGVFYVKRTSFLEAHGYDERLTTYGWDDSDLYERLERAGLRQKIMRFDMLHHLSHSDDAREANQELRPNLMGADASVDGDDTEGADVVDGGETAASTDLSDPMLATQVSRYTTDFALRWLMPSCETYNFDHQRVAFRVVMLSLAEQKRAIRHSGNTRDHSALFADSQSASMNSLALRELAPWGSEADARESLYFFRVLADDFSRLEALAVRTPPSVLDQLPESTRQRIKRTAEQRVLHDAYGVPWDVIMQLDAARGDLLCALRAIHSSANSRWGHGLGLVIAEISGSPAERLLALASAMGFASEQRRPLVISWRPALASDSPGSARQRGYVDERTENASVDLFDQYFDEQLSSVSHESSAFSPGHDGGSVDGGDANAVPESTRLFVVREWKCHERLDTCMEWDKAYGRVMEFVSGRDESIVDRAVRGEVIGKHHLLLRLSAGLNCVSKTAKARALTALVPSGALVRRVQALRDAVSGSLGLFIGAGLKPRALAAVAQRVARQAKSRKVGVFVVGQDDDDVREVRRHLGDIAVQIPRTAASPESILPESTQTLSLNGDTSAESEERAADELQRRLAELYALGIFCRDIINDGKLPVAIAQLVDLFRAVRAART